MAGVVSGVLRAQTWTKTLSSWGYFAIDYSTSIDVPGGIFRCFIPWPWSSGVLPAQLTHRAIGYGDVWLWSPTDTTFTMVPVFP